MIVHTVNSNSSTVPCQIHCIVVAHQPAFLTKLVNFSFYEFIFSLFSWCCSVLKMKFIDFLNGFSRNLLEGMCSFHNFQRRNFSNEETGREKQGIRKVNMLRGSGCRKSYDIFFDKRFTFRFYFIFTFFLMYSLCVLKLSCENSSLDYRKFTGNRLPEMFLFRVNNIFELKMRTSAGDPLHHQLL